MANSSRTGIISNGAGVGVKSGFFALMALLITLLGVTLAFAVSPLPADLGSASSFEVLGSSTVTNTGSTTVAGDLGVSPGTAVTGFPPGIVTGGTIHTNDAPASQAQSGVTIAYNNLSGRACDTDLSGQDLGGRTLVPGVYCFSTSAQLTGNLTLDAQGSSDAVFIFQVGSTLTTASASSVSLINNASPCNVFWQVGSSATFGTNTAFKGNVIALSSITATTGTNLNGRALARTGAVTLDTNNVFLLCVNTTLPNATNQTNTTGNQTNQTNQTNLTNLTVTKVVINDNGGTKNVSDFPLYVNSTLVLSGETNEFSAGAYVVTETNSAGYEASIGGDCAFDGSITLALGEQKNCTITNNDVQQLTCEQAIKKGLLKGYITNGSAIVYNDANESYLISLASYKMYAATLFDQTLFDNVSFLLPGQSTTTLEVDVPACGYQIDLVCGLPLTTIPDYGNKTIDFDFGNQNNYCPKETTGDVQLSIAPWYPQNGSYVFLCTATGFNATLYDWYFGDGQLQLNSNNMNVFHKYQPGNYTVSCTAKNSNQSGSDTLNVQVGGVVVPPVNQTNVTNSTNQTNATNQTSACFNKVKDLPASCTGGNITLDVTGGCRTIICENGSSSLKVSACDKPTSVNPAYFEMYKQLQVGTDVTQICLGSTCIGNNGFAKSDSFPICIGNQTPANDTPLVNLTPPNGTNQTNQTGNVSAVLSIAPWFPQGGNYVSSAARKDSLRQAMTGYSAMGRSSGITARTTHIIATQAAAPIPSSASLRTSK
jgi:hypothetical protein